MRQFMLVFYKMYVHAAIYLSTYNVHVHRAIYLTNHTIYIYWKILFSISIRIVLIPFMSMWRFIYVLTRFIYFVQFI